MEDIYVIFGSCGEHSDRREWPVCYTESELEAQRLVELCQRQATALPDGFDEWDYMTAERGWTPCPRVDDYSDKDAWKRDYITWCERISALRAEILAELGVTLDTDIQTDWGRSTRYHYLRVRRAP